MAQLQRPPQLLPVIDSLESPKFSISLFRIKELFKGLTAPKHDPSIFGQSKDQVPQTPNNTISTTSTTIVDGKLFINGHQALELSSQCHALPTMILPAECLQIWESQIKDRLQDELAQRFRTEHCHAEFNMIQDRRGRLGPCILLSCWNGATCGTEEGREQTRKKLQKRVKKLQSLQGCRYPCKIVIDEIGLLARLATAEALDVDIYASADACIRSYVSLPVQGSSHGHQTCTFGGLISVGSEVFVLTVAHPFLTDETVSNQSHLRPAIVESSSEEDEDTDSDSDRSLFPSVELDSLSPITANSSLSTELSLSSTLGGEESPIEPTMGEPLQITVGFHVAHAENFSTSKSIDLDWALCRLADTARPLQNSYLEPRTQKTVVIQGSESATLPPGTNVFVLAGRSGPQVGKLGQSNVDLRLRGRKYAVTQIVLQEKLVPGDSGCWVVRKDNVVGCVIAGRDLLPMAYMIPIHCVFEDISRSLVQEVSVRNVLHVQFDTVLFDAESGSDGDHASRQPDELTILAVNRSPETEELQPLEATAGASSPSLSSQTIEEEEHFQLREYLPESNQGYVPPRKAHQPLVSPSEPGWEAMNGHGRDLAHFRQPTNTNILRQTRLETREQASANQATRVAVLVAWILIFVAVGVDFGYMLNASPRISKVTSKWYWTPLYGVAYYFAAGIAAVVWSSDRPDRHGTLIFGYIIFAVGFILTISVQQYQLLLLWRFLTGFGAMRIINQGSDLPVGLSTHIRLGSAALGALLGTFIPQSSSPSDGITDAFIPVFLVLDMGLLGLVFISSPWKSVQRPLVHRDREQRNRDFEDTQVAPRSCCLGSNAPVSLDFFFRYFCRYPLIEAELFSIDPGYHSHFARRDRLFYPTKYGVLRLAFLMAVVIGLALLFATSFVATQQQLSILGAVSGGTMLCLLMAVILGRLCWRHDLQQLRRMLSALNIICNNFTPRHIWTGGTKQLEGSSLVVFMLYLVAELAVGMASASHLYLAPVVLQDALGLPPFRAATALSIYFAAAIAGVIYFYALERLQFYVRGLRQPQLTSLFQRSLLVCRFALPTVLPIGCIIAYVRSAILESFDYNRLYFVTLFMAGVGSVCLARQIWCFAYIMVEGGIPGRAAIAEIITTALKAAYIFGCAIGLSASQTMLLRGAYPAPSNLDELEAARFVMEACHEAFLVPLTTALISAALMMLGYTVHIFCGGAQCRPPADGLHPHLNDFDRRQIARTLDSVLRDLDLETNYLSSKTSRNADRDSMGFLEIPLHYAEDCSRRAGRKLNDHGLESPRFSLRLRNESMRGKALVGATESGISTSWYHGNEPVTGIDLEFEVRSRTPQPRSGKDYRERLSLRESRPLLSQDDGHGEEWIDL